MTFGKRGDRWGAGRAAIIACVIAVSILTAQFGGYPAIASAEPIEASGAEAITRFRVYFPLYLASGSYVYPVEYYVPETEDSPRAAIEALVAGLPDDGSFGFVPIPETTEVLGLTIEDGLCTVDFSEDILKVNVGSGGESALVNAIVWTLVQFPDIDKVSITVGGEPVETLAGHVDITEPLERGSDSVVFRGFEDCYQHWAGGAVMVLQSMDILNGRAEGVFEPDGKLTRAEFVKMLVEALTLSEAPDQDVPFTDVDAHWSKPYIQKALASRVISASDYASGFRPDEVIPREEMAYLLVPASESYREAHPAIQYPAPSAVPVFTDYDEIDPKYVGSVEECAKLGLLEGYPDGTFAPQGGLTRGEAATVLTRAMGVRGAGTHVVVSSPRPGAKWDDGQFVILGAASAFEGTVNFRFIDSNDEVLYENYTTSTLGMGWGAIGVSVDTSLFGGDPTLLEVFLVSMKDGSDFVITGVPIERR